MKKFALLLALTTSLGLAQADNAPPDGAPPRGGAPGHNPALEAALKACEATLSSSSNQLPDATTMDACMTAKGYEKPAKPPVGSRPVGN